MQKGGITLKIIGLTGGSGAGKGEVCAILQKYGIPAVNTDAVYHALLETDAALKNELTAAFGEDILENGSISRARLAKSVFVGAGHADRLHTLNAITHKYIMARAWETVEDFRRDGARAAVIDAPQLFEAGVDADCDILLGVIADPTLRTARIVARDGISDAAAAQRIMSQHDEGFYRSHCHYILENNGDTATLELAVRRFLEESGLGL